MRIENNKSTTKNIAVLLLFEDSAIVFAEQDDYNEITDYT